MWSVLLLSQLANSEELNPEELAPEIPKVWVECAPISGLLALESILPASFRKTTEGLGKAGLEGFRNAGGNPNGVMRAFGQEALVVEMPFTGTAEQVGDMIELLHSGSPYWQISDTTWRVEELDDSLIVEKGEGKLLIHSMHIDAIPFAPKESTVLQNYGSNRSDGCAIVVNSDVEIPRIKVPMNGGLFIPFGNDPFSIVFTPKQSLPKFFKPTGAQAMVISTQFEPAIVAVMGYDWEALFNDPKIRESFELSEREARKLSKRLRIQPGSVIASKELNFRENPQLAVGLELHNRFGKPQCEWLIWRGVKRSLANVGFDPMVLDERLLSFEYNGQAIYMSVAKGRLLMANNRLMVDEMTLNEGTQWVNESLKNLSTTQPIAVQLRIPQMVGMLAGGIQSLELGVGPVDSMLHLTIRPTFAGTAGWTSVLPFIAGQLPEPTPESPIRDFERRIQSLAAQEHQHFATTGQYQPIGRTGMFSDPELIAELSVVDSAPVVESAVAIGWMEQPKDGLYWVETTSETFMVHALVYVDGQFLHITKDHTGLREIELVD